MVRFLHNHGLLLVTGRPQWCLILLSSRRFAASVFIPCRFRYSIIGGSRLYVNAIVDGVSDARLNCPVTSICRDGGSVLVTTERGVEAFDEVVIATHAPQALQLLHEVPSRCPCPTLEFAFILVAAISIRARRAWRRALSGAYAG